MYVTERTGLIGAFLPTPSYQIPTIDIEAPSVEQVAHSLNQTSNHRYNNGSDHCNSLAQVCLIMCLAVGVGSLLAAFYLALEEWTRGSGSA